MFLTVAVIVWGILELVQARSKNKLLKKMETGEDKRKKYGDRIERLERRVANLEAIVVDEESSRSATSHKMTYTANPYPVKRSLPLFNKLKNQRQLLS